MDLFNVLTYLNKFSLIAFFVTALILVYQVYLIKKDKEKNHPPVTNIPDFNEKMTIPIKNFTDLDTTKIISTQKPISKGLLYGIISITTICLLLVLTIFSRVNKTKNIAYSSPTPVITKNQIIKPTKSAVSTPTIVITQATQTPSKTPTLTQTIGENVKNVVGPVTKPTEKTETVIAYNSITPTTLLTISPTIIASSSISPTMVSSLPVTGTIENGLIIMVISSFMVFLAFVF